MVHRMDKESSPSTNGESTQQGKKHGEPETGTLINPSPVGERKPCFTDGHWLLEPNGHCRSTCVHAVNRASNITCMHTLLGYLFGGQVVIVQLPLPLLTKRLVFYSRAWAATHVMQGPLPAQ